MAASLFKFDTSANAPSTTRQGAMTGASMGSLFGPPGAAVGALLGAGVGALTGNSGRERARAKATRQSYKFAKDLFSFTTESRTGINKEYDRNLSELVAISASRGGVSTDVFAAQKGKLIQTRDSALEGLRSEQQAYREGPNYEWFMKDYERVTGIKRTGLSAKGEDNYTWTIGGGESRRDKTPSPYTDSMRSRMEFTKTSNASEVDLLEEYTKRVKPSVGQYERLVFGGSEDKKSYEEYMSNRIDAANKWLRAERAIREREQQQLKSNRALMGGQQ